MHNTHDLREVLIKDLMDFREGKITAREARVRAAMARNIIDTVKIELAASAMKGAYSEPVRISKNEAGLR